MTKETHRFLDDYGTQEMFGIFLEISDDELDKRIINVINDASDEEHIPTAASLYKALKKIFNGIDFHTGMENLKKLCEKIELKADVCDRSSHFKTQIVSGNINNVTDPNEETIYFQRDNASDKTWQMYVYSVEEKNGTHWITVGDTAPDLVGYLKKSEVDELKTFLGITEEIDYLPMTSSYIKGRVNFFFNKNKPA